MQTICRSKIPFRGFQPCSLRNMVNFEIKENLKKQNFFDLSSIELLVCLISLLFCGLSRTL